MQTQKKKEVAPCRVIIGAVEPCIDGGRYPAKRCVRETVQVTARIFLDGPEPIAARLLFRPANTSRWQESRLVPSHNDYWHGEFTPPSTGDYVFTVRAWVSYYGAFQSSLRKKWAADLPSADIELELLVGHGLLQRAMQSAPAALKKRLSQCAANIVPDSGLALGQRVELALDEEIGAAMEDLLGRKHASVYQPALHLWVDDAKAGFSTWYELFPRSVSSVAGKHGTFKDVQAHLPYVAHMGFDVLYLPPIHPIGTTFRKGPNNALVAGANDPGSPWAIGSAEGGHKSVHSELGTLEDFRELVRVAREQHGIDIALDIAFQCSPDHPYVKEHPEWFKKRPDGTIQYAENPPKKYQDVYPFDFECAQWRELWEELKSVFDFWMEQGVRIFRVDNPHTKPFAFWEWTIAELRKQRKDFIFLSEAFTRPAPMYHLAKIGFAQSYTYFTWRNHKHEIEEYLTELRHTEIAQFFRPNFWPNTPDILHEYLQQGGRGAFMARLVLAATLSPNYGMYGPAFELCEARPREQGSEEYLDSEKYQLRHWNLDSPSSIQPLITKVNQLRRGHRVFQGFGKLSFHPTDNENIMCYSLASGDLSEIFVITVNLDPHHTQAGWVELPARKWGLPENFQVQDVLTDAEYDWRGAWNFVQLDPAMLPAHILRVRTES